MSSSSDLGGSKAFTLEHMRKGVDEDGNRIKVFTSAMENENAVKAGVGKFTYNGGSLHTNNDMMRFHSNNLKHTEARHGQGECLYDSGASYKGEWAMDKREGKGRFTYTCGDYYEGEWLKGKYHGHGKYVSTRGGDEYEGQWKMDKMEGSGTHWYKEDNEKYTGSFISGLRGGMGRYNFANGNIYEGQYHEGERHGSGTFHHKVTSEAEVGRYSEGKDTGEGARWNEDRSAACRLRDGEVADAISLDEAAGIAAGLGLKVPPVVPTLSSGKFTPMVEETPPQSYVTPPPKQAEVPAKPRVPKPPPAKVALPFPVPQTPASSPPTSLAALSPFSFGADGRMKW